MSATQTTQQRIIDSAFELIYAQSYAEVGVAAICEKAGVKKGSFYHFFKSKQALVLTVLEQKFCDYKATILDQCFTGQQSALDEIALFAEKNYQLQQSIKSASGHVFGCPYGNMALELSSQDETVRKKLVNIFDRTKQEIRQCLQRGIDNNDEQLRGINVDATADAMYAYLEGILLLAKARNDVELLPQLAPAILNVRIFPNNPND